MNRITVAVAAVLAGAAAQAQTIPHQSPARSSVGAGLGQTELPKGGRFEPRIEAALQYAANLNLAEDGDPQVDMGGVELAPGFYASYSTGNAIGAIDYSLIGRAWEETDFNEVSHRLSANGQWYAVPEWFSLRGQASYSDAVIDPLDGVDYGGIGIFGPGNLSEVAAASVNPVLQHTFNFLAVTAQYSYGRTWYVDEGKGQPTVGVVTDQDSTDQSAYAAIGTADRDARLSATAYYDWSKSEYDTALPYKFERAGLDAGYQVSRTLTLLAQYGQESDLEVSSIQGGLDSEFWDAGLRWEPNDRTSVEARYGDRFFGGNWSFSASHTARILEFTASYSEQPTVETRALSLGDFDPGTLPPGAPDFDFGRFNSSPYIARNAAASIRAVGSRTTLGLSARHFERDYLQIQRGDETGLGVSFSAARQMASNLSADLTLSYDDYERSFDVNGGPVADVSGETDAQAVFRLNRSSGEKLSLSAEVGYLTRNGDRDYDGFWTGVRARWTP